MGDISRLLADNILQGIRLALRHVDELYGARRKGIGAKHQGSRNERVTGKTEGMSAPSSQAGLKKPNAGLLGPGRKDEIMRAGPDGIWDAIAQQVEKLVERIER